MIPKIIHYCWFGNKDLPEESVAFINEWSVLNPDWEIKLWNEAISPMDVPYMEAAYAGKHFSNMSNFIRLYALKEEGGVYLDTDVKLIKSLDSLTDNKCFFGFEDGSESSDVFWVNNAICGAEKGNSFIEECYKYLILTFDGTEQSNLSGPRSTTELLVNLKGLSRYGLQELDDVKLYPKEYFYPIHYSEVFKLNFLEKHLYPETIAVHVWARTWLTNEILLHIVDDLYEKQVKVSARNLNHTEANQGAQSVQSESRESFSAVKEHLNALSYDFLYIRNLASSINEEKEKLKASLSNSESELKSAELEVLTLKHEKELMQKDMQHVSSEVATLKSEVVTLKKESSKYKSVVKALQEELVAQKNSLEVSKQLVKESNTSIASLQAISKQLNKEKEALMLAHSSLKEEHQALSDKAAELKVTINTLERQAQEHQGTIENGRGEVKRLTNEVKYLHQAINWYKSTYENRKIGGIVKDKLRRKLSVSPKISDWVKGYHKLKRGKESSRFSKKILCSIVNYNCNANALELRKNLSRYFDTVVFDSGSKEKHSAFINLGNVYYSGLLNNSYQYAKEKGYDHLLFICSDVEVSPEEADKMALSLEQLDLDEIGLYSPASKGRSHSFCKKVFGKGLRPVPFTEGFIFMSSMDVLDQFLPMDLNVNLYGWGLDVTKGYFSRKLGKLCVIDDGVEVYHPESTGYSNNKAELDMWHWVDTFDDFEFKNFFTKHISLIRNGQTDSLKVSVIVPCYNQSPYIKETLYSVLAQEYTALEVLVIDDGSTDDSAQIVRELAGKFPVISYHYKKNGGLGNARNYGLSIAKGDFVQFLDADDKLSSNKLLNQVYSVINDATIEVSYTPYLCFEHENPSNTWTYSRVALHGDPALDLIQNWEKDLSIPVHCFLIKRSILSDISFDEELPNHEDWLFHLFVASSKPTYHFVDSGTAYYRVRKDSMARDKSLMITGKKMCLEKAIKSGKFSATEVSELAKRLSHN